MMISFNLFIDVIGEQGIMKAKETQINYKIFWNLACFDANIIDYTINYSVILHCGGEDSYP